MLKTLPVPAGTSWTPLYACAAATRTVGEVRFTNTAASDVPVGLAITSGASASTAPAPGVASPASPTCAVYEFNRIVGAAGVSGNGPLTDSVVVFPGQYVWVQAAAAGVSATMQGIEE